MGFLAHVEREARDTCLRELSEAGFYTPAGGARRRVSFMFRRIADVQDIGEMIQMDGLAATGTFAEADVPEMALGDALEARGLSYKVVGVEPNNRGRVVVMLGI